MFFFEEGFPDIENLPPGFEPSVYGRPGPLMTRPKGLDLAIEARLDGVREGVPYVHLRSAHRRVNRTGFGLQIYRKVSYPGDKKTSWPDGPKLPKYMADHPPHNKTCYMIVPVGTIVIEQESRIYKRQRKDSIIRVGIAYHKDGGGHIEWLDHRFIKSRKVYRVTLPNNQVIDIERDY